MTRTLRNNNSSWEQYVAAVVGSFLIKVLQEDHVFAKLGRENSESRGPGALSSFSQQEFVPVAGIAKNIVMKVKHK